MGLVVTWYRWRHEFCEIEIARGRETTERCIVALLSRSGQAEARESERPPGLELFSLLPTLSVYVYVVASTALQNYPARFLPGEHKTTAAGDGQGESEGEREPPDEGLPYTIYVTFLTSSSEL